MQAEHGLSFFIEKDGHKLLFDTGQSGKIIENAAQLRVDLTSLEYVVLSHGHYDHSGGLQSLATITTDFKLIMGQGFFDKKYGCKKIPMSISEIILMNSFWVSRKYHINLRMRTSRNSSRMCTS